MNDPIIKRLRALGVNDEVKKFHYSVHWRRVFNDAVVGEWQRMPEIKPPTLQGLVKYLKGDHDWNIVNVELDRCFETSLKKSDQVYFVVDYGLRQQFIVPGILSEEDRAWLRSEKMKGEE